METPNEIREADCAIIAVAHEAFKDFGLEKIPGMYRNGTDKVLIDVMGIYRTAELEKQNWYGGAFDKNCGTKHHDFLTFEHLRQH